VIDRKKNLNGVKVFSDTPLKTLVKEHSVSHEARDVFGIGTAAQSQLTTQMTRVPVAVPSPDLNKEKRNEFIDQHATIKLLAISPQNADHVRQLRKRMMEKYREHKSVRVKAPRPLVRPLIVDLNTQNAHLTDSKLSRGNFQLHGQKCSYLNITNVTNSQETLEYPSKSSNTR
jgi:hypothetical protein